MLESKSSHESLNLAHESDSNPSPGLQYYTGTSPAGSFAAGFGFTAALAARASSLGV